MTRHIPQDVAYQLLEVCRSLSRLAPSNEGLGGHAPLEAFFEIAQRARPIVHRADDPSHSSDGWTLRTFAPSGK